MIEAAVYIIIGMFIGWSFPQPEWAIVLQEKVVAWVKGWFNRV